MPPVSRISDYHKCPKVDPPAHVGGPILTGCATVLVGNLPVARVGDKAKCNGPTDTIAKGSSTVLIGGQLTARIGDRTAHGGVIRAGRPTVIVGG